MRAGRHLWVAIVGIVAAGSVHLQPSLAGEAHEAHPHQAAPCSLCHVQRRAGAETRQPVDVCATCHGQQSPAEESLGAWGPDGLTGSPEAGLGMEVASVRDDHGSQCTRCHSFHTPTTIALVDRKADISDPKVANHCVSCHSHSDRSRLARLTEGHRAAATLYHGLGSDLADYTPSDACLFCHDRGRGLPINLPVSLPIAPRFEAHASHPYGVRMAGAGDFFRPVIDSRIRLFDGRIECQTCHDLSAQNEDLIVVFETKYEMCRGCHTQGLPQNRFQDGLVQK